MAQTVSGRLSLILVTRDRALLDLVCDEVTLPGREGDLGILPGHAALIATLRPGVVTYRDGSRRESVAVASGFCHVHADRVAVLVDNAHRADEIDVDATRSRLRELEVAVARAEPDQLETAYDRVREAEAQLQIAVVR
jgi:F-type H+-transporting ATPase subunit epsilon